MNEMNIEIEKLRTSIRLNLHLANQNIHNQDFKLAITQLQSVRRSLEKLECYHNHQQYF